MDEARIIPLHSDQGEQYGQTEQSEPAAEPARHATPAGQTRRSRTAKVRPPREPVEALPAPEPVVGAVQLESAGDAVDTASSTGSVVRKPAGWERRVAGGLAFLRRRLAGEYEIDDFGFDPDLTENVFLPALKPLYHAWFRTEVNGINNIPETGGALLVANHAGGLWPMDAAMLAIGVHEEHPANRFLRLLGADLVFTTPVIGSVARKTGTTLACNSDAERLLGNGELVGVFPEGFKGIGKPFSDRYKLQRFGRGGFVTSALKAGVPIIPVSIVGSEEIHPMIGNVKTLARILNLPYFPITPTFPWLGPVGLIPLPSKWYIEFGEPVSTEGYGPDAVDDPMLVFELTDRVRETIQATLYRLLLQRQSVWR